MKFKLITALAVAFTVVSCNKKGEETTQTTQPEAKPVVEEAKPSVVSGSIAPVAQKFDGEKYVSTQLAHDTDYFIVYFTASW